MNKSFALLVSFFIFTFCSLSAQHSAIPIETQSATTAKSTSAPLTLKINQSDLQSWGVRIDGLSDPQVFEVSYRVKYDNEEWSELKSLEKDEHLMDGQGKWMSALQFMDENRINSHQKVQLQFIFSNVAFAKAELHAINVSKNENADTPVQHRADCKKPETLDRSEWCEGNCPQDPSPQPTHQEFMIVHHSATSNTSSDWSAVVESFYNYHVNGNGWDDIGYNWLIDPDGVIYTGRGDELQGAHFCAQNGETAGICMIGTYIDVLPTEKAMESLKKLLGWKITKENLDPTGTALHSSSGKILPRITGHRIDCTTECPGDMLFQRLQTFPSDVSETIENCGDTVNRDISLSASVLYDGSALLEWEESNVNTDQWEIYRKAFDNEYEKVAIIDGDDRRWTDSDLKYEYRYTYYITGSDGNAESNEAEVFIKVNDIMEGISVYPNPTAGNLNIKIANDERGEYELKMLNMRGEEVSRNIYEVDYLKESPIHHIEFDLNVLQSGVYQLYIMRDEKVTTRRIVVQ